ncbi:hypothetical protein ACPPVV_05515 [Rhodanobacter sp. Col0626]|uniref:hypothetical protein n=1 Tax=Rhodanobacter sp. Col0626 TaxID=3415679 RepID=UPI003CEEBC80
MDEVVDMSVATAGKASAKPVNSVAAVSMVALAGDIRRLTGCLREVMDAMGIPLLDVALRSTGLAGLANAGCGRQEARSRSAAGVVSTTAINIQKLGNFPATIHCRNRAGAVAYDIFNENDLQ